MRYPGSCLESPAGRPSGRSSMSTRLCVVLQWIALSCLAIAPLFAGARASAATQGTATVSGSVTRQSNGAPVFQARVTLFTSNLSFFRETRTAADGSYDFTGVARGIYRLGVAAQTLDYVEINAPVVTGPNTLN